MPAIIVVILVLAVLAAGCGSGGSKARGPGALAPVCAKGLPVLAARMHVAVKSIATRLTSTSDKSPQCDFRVTGSADSLALSVSLDSSPQPYEVLERQIVEESQMFTPVRAAPAPQAVLHLGLDAAWFPQEQYVLTTDGRTLINVTVVRWPEHGNAPRKALAAAVARPYLGRLVRGKTIHGEV